MPRFAVQVRPFSCQNQVFVQHQRKLDTFSLHVLLHVITLLPQQLCTISQVSPFCGAMRSLSVKWNAKCRNRITLHEVNFSVKQGKDSSYSEPRYVSLNVYYICESEMTISHLSRLNHECKQFKSSSNHLPMMLKKSDPH